MKKYMLKILKIKNRVNTRKIMEINKLLRKLKQKKKNKILKIIIYVEI